MSKHLPGGIPQATARAEPDRLASRRVPKLRLSADGLPSGVAPGSGHEFKVGSPEDDRNHMAETVDRLRGWRLAVRVAEELAVGERPQDPRPGARPPRAARTTLKRVQVDPRGVTWVRRDGRAAHLDAREIARVALIDVVSGRGGDFVTMYAVVVDHEGAARLRVAADGAVREAAASKRRLREVWGPLGVPVKLETTTSGSPKDYRRRWPEAFGFVPAHPVVTLVLLAAFWMIVVVPILDHTIGP